MDLSSFVPKKPTPRNEIHDHRAVEAAREIGFVGRPEPTKVDGRMLRRKGKEQMNMRLLPHTQNEFKKIIAEFADADECVAALIRLYHGRR